MGTGNFVGATDALAKRPAQAPRTRRARRARRATSRTTTPTAKAREVSATELEQIIAAGARPLLLDAYAPWCGPCQFMLPELDVVAQRYGDAVDILKLDTEQYPDLASAMRIRGLPTLMFIKDTELLFRMEGALPSVEIEKLVNYLFFDGPKPGSEKPEPIDED